MNRTTARPASLLLVLLVCAAPASVRAQAVGVTPTPAPAPFGLPGVQITPNIPFIPPIQVLPGVQIGPAPPAAPPGYPPGQQPPPGYGVPVQQYPPAPGQQPPPGYAVPGQQPPPGYGVPGQQPPPGYAVPGQQPPPGYAVPGQQPPPGYVVPPPQAVAPPAAPPASKPTVAEMSFFVGADINPDLRGRPSPVIVRTYELKSTTAFNRSDFFAVFDRDKEILGADLIARDEWALTPGDNRQVLKNLQGETRYVGVIAAFRDMDRGQWRATTAISSNQTNRMEIRLDRNEVNIRLH